MTAVELQQRFLDESVRGLARGDFDGTVPRAAEIISIWQETLEQLARRRKMASDFLFVTAFEAHGRAIKDLLDKELKADNIDNPLAGVRFIVEAARAREQALLSRDPQADLAQVTSQLRTLESRAQADDVRTDPDRMKILDQVATILGFQLWKIRHPTVMLNFLASRGGTLPEDLYFGGTRKPVKKAA